MTRSGTGAERRDTVPLAIGARDAIHTALGQLDPRTLPHLVACWVLKASGKRQAVLLELDQKRFDHVKVLLWTYNPPPPVGFPEIQRSSEPVNVIM